MSHMNESCHIWMSHVTYEWVMSHMNESCHIWTSHVTYECVIKAQRMFCAWCYIPCHILHVDTMRVCVCRLTECVYIRMMEKCVMHGTHMFCGAMLHFMPHSVPWRNVCVCTCMNTLCVYECMLTGCGNLGTHVGWLWRVGSIKL